MPADALNRRRFLRIQAPVMCRPRSALAARAPHEVRDISLGGLRVYSDDPHPLGARLELELVLPDGALLVFDAEVVWVDPLPGESPARFDVGLRYLELQEGDRDRLQEVLGREEP